MIKKATIIIVSVVLSVTFLVAGFDTDTNADSPAGGGWRNTQLTYRYVCPSDGKLVGDVYEGDRGWTAKVWPGREVSWYPHLEEQYGSYGQATRAAERYITENKSCD